MIQFNCPSCGAAMSIPDNYAGQRGKCNGCGKPVTAPGVTASFIPDAKPTDKTKVIWKGRPGILGTCVIWAILLTLCGAAIPPLIPVAAAVFFFGVLVWITTTYTVTGTTITVQKLFGRSTVHMRDIRTMRESLGRLYIDAGGAKGYEAVLYYIPKKTIRTIESLTAQCKH